MIKLSILIALVICNSIYSYSAPLTSASSNCLELWSKKCKENSDCCSNNCLISDLAQKLDFSFGMCKDIPGSHNNSQPNPNQDENIEYTGGRKYNRNVIVYILGSNDSNCKFESPHKRIDCSFPNITRKQCEQKMCCFDDTIPDVYKCFFGTKSAPVVYSVSWGHNGEHHAEGGLTRWQNGDQDGGQVFFSNVDAFSKNGSIGASAETGFIKQKTNVGGLGVAHNILTAKGEVFVGKGGIELFGRANAVDGTLTVGPVDINYGVGLDTGISVKKWNIEAKYLGIGGKVGKDGIEVCFIACIGINW